MQLRIMLPCRWGVAACLALTLQLLALPSGSSSAADADAAFPYVAYVIESDTYIRSGPGSQHYPTGQLPAGYAVEIFRHDGEGWCAIRPPEGSFSLAPAHQLRIIDGRTAEVVAGGVVARVGSSLASQRNAVQVMLEQGEVIQLVEPPAPNDPWVKIAPPAGEFRWIAARRLSRMPPLEAQPAPRPANNGWQAQATREDAYPEVSSATNDGAAPTTPPWLVQPTVAQGNAFGHLDSAPPAMTNPVLGPVSANRIAVVPGSPADVRLAQHQQGADAAAPTSEKTAPPPVEASVASSPPGQPRIRFRGLSAGPPADARVAEMQVRLSQIVVQPPTSWQFAPLREETAALLAQEQSAEAREELRDLLERIATFETVQARYRSLPVTPSVAAITGATTAAPLNQSVAAAVPPAAATGGTGDVLARVQRDLGIDRGVTPTPGGPAADKAVTDALYDAVGTLKPVVSRRDQAPRFALVDDHGDVVTFVTANAEVNLQPYVGKRIGVRGSRGYMPEYRRAHVTASRVTPLEEKLVR